MRPAKHEDIEEIGQDSFLDVVSNIVGILVLLVVIVGARSSQFATQKVAETHPQVTPALLIKAETEVRREHNRLENKSARIAETQQERLLREDERLGLTTLVMKLEGELADERAAMGENQQRDFDLRTKLAEAQHQLDELARQQVSLVSLQEEPAPEAEVVEVSPTPIILGEIAERKEKMFFIVRQGTIAELPVGELDELVLKHLRLEKPKLASRNKIAGLTESADGYRARYFMQKLSPAESELLGIPLGELAFGYEVVQPVYNSAAEPISEALQTGSRFQRVLAAHNSATHICGLYIYEDCFGESPAIEKLLRVKGFSIAKVLLSASERIGFSNAGQKLQAQ